MDFTFPKPSSLSFASSIGSLSPSFTNPMTGVPSASPNPVPMPTISTMSNMDAGRSDWYQTPFGPTEAQWDAWQGRNGIGKSFYDPNGSLNMDTIGTLVKGIGAFGSLWGSLQANKMAKKQFAFEKNAYNQNYQNQLDLTNQNISDKISNRYAFQGRSQAEADTEIARRQIG